LKSRDHYHLLASKTSLWVTPLCGVAFLGLAWLIGRVVTIPVFVYWLIVVLLGLTWLGDVINVIVLSRRNQR
jgi:hypothetical protein